MTLPQLAAAMALVLPRLHPAADVLPALHAAAVAAHVPPQLLVATCAVESGLRPRGLLCGAYGAANTPAAQGAQASRVLAVGLARCRTWAGAATYFYSGGCRARSVPRRGVRDPLDYGVRVAALALRMGAR